MLKLMKRRESKDYLKYIIKLMLNHLYHIKVIKSRNPIFLIIIENSSECNNLIYLINEMVYPLMIGNNENKWRPPRKSGLTTKTIEAIA